MRYFPVLLDIVGRSCLVIGHGKMADQKAAQLAAAGAQVRRSGEFDPQEARQVSLIVAVVDDAEYGSRIKKFGDQHRILVNVHDQPRNCGFIAPAIVDRGNLLIAVSTCGKSPALASRIRKELEHRFGPEYSDLLDALAEVRPLVKEQFPSFEDRKNFYTRLVAMDLLEILKQEGLEMVRNRIKEEMQKQSSQGART